MCAWIDYDRDKKRTGYLRALGWFLIAMLGKPTMLMFPPIILLFAWWRRSRISGKDVRVSLPFFAISLVFGLIGATLSKVAAEPTSVTAGGAARLATAGWEMLIFAGKCLFPVQLLPLYPSRLVVSPSPIDLAPWLLMTGILALLWLKRDGWGQHALLGLGFFLLNLVPVLGFIVANATTMIWSMEHLVYLPLIGLIGLAAAAWGELKVHRPWMIAGLSIVLALLALRAHAYATVFRDEESLWTATLEGNPESAIAHNNLGRFDVDHGQYPEAEEQFRAAIRLKPDYAYAHNGLGNALAMSAKLDEAAAEYREALKAKPDYPEAHNGLANVLLHLNRLNEARAECAEALKLSPHYVEAICTLGLIDATEGKIADAIRQFETALQLRPNDPRIAQELDALRAQR
jgi:Flp pilus assembly protein TadD